MLRKYSSSWWTAFTSRAMPSEAPRSTSLFCELDFAIPCRWPKSACSESSKRARCLRRNALMRERGKERKNECRSNANEMSRSQSKQPACSCCSVHKISCWSLHCNSLGSAMRNIASPMRCSTLDPSKRKASHTRSVVSTGSELAKRATNLRRRHGVWAN